jgi:hypothetical protein
VGCAHHSERNFEPVLVAQYKAQSLRGMARAGKMGEVTTISMSLFLTNKPKWPFTDEIALLIRTSFLLIWFGPINLPQQL